MNILEKVKLRLKLPTPTFFIRLFNTILKTTSGMIAISILALTYSEYFPDTFITVLKYFISAGVSAILVSYFFSKLPVAWHSVSQKEIEQLPLPPHIKKSNLENELSV